MSPSIALPWQQSASVPSIAIAGTLVTPYRLAFFRVDSSFMSTGDGFFLGILGWALGLAGRGTEAHTILSNLERRRTAEYVGGCVLALVSLGQGDRDQAISWLQQGVEERDGLMPYLHAWPPWAPLRTDPRFQALLRRMNFPKTAGTPPSA